MKIIDIPRSGSYADKTSSRNRGGQYVRNRRAPVQPLGNGRRAFIRATLSAASTAWGALTDAQRAAWTGYADSNPTTDSLGQSITLTGHQIFVGIYTQCVNCGFAAPTVPPLDNTTPGLTDVVLTLTLAGEVVTVDFISSGAAADKILFSFSPQVGAGRSFNGRWVQLITAIGNATTVDASTVYSAEFGDLQAGKRIFAKVTPVNQYGVSGSPVVVSAIVA